MISRMFVKHEISTFTNLVICLLFIAPSRSLSKTSKVLIIPVKQDISPSASRLLSKGLLKANMDSFDIVILDMNTYGGLLADADSMRTAILNYPKPIWVFINKNAASAGALISLACDRIYMQSGSNIGAATVVDQDGDKAPDKYQSYMRGLMRSTAEARGKNGDSFIRNPMIAEAMVDQDIEIEGITKMGQVVTFTTEEALKFGFCDGKFESISEILSENKLDNADLTRYEPSSLDKIIGWLLSPGVRGILIAGIVLGLYFEIQTPGLGIPSLAALCAAILYFAPAYLEGLAENWEIILFAVGLLLILLELFVIPGFGIAGISGIIVTVGSLVLAMLRNVQLDFSLVGFESAFLTIAILFFVTIGFILFLIFIPKKNKTQLFSKLVLDTTLENAKANSFGLPESLLNKTVEVIHECKPMGNVIYNKQMYPAKSIHGIRKRGSKVRVIEVRPDILIVD